MFIQYCVRSTRPIAAVGQATRGRRIGRRRRQSLRVFVCNIFIGLAPSIHWSGSYICIMVVFTHTLTRLADNHLHSNDNNNGLARSVRHQSIHRIPTTKKKKKKGL